MIYEILEPYLEAYEPFLYWFPTLVGMTFMILSYIAYRRGKSPVYCVTIAIIPAAIFGLTMMFLIGPQVVWVAWTILTDYSNPVGRGLSVWMRVLMAMAVILFTIGLFIISTLIVVYLALRSYAIPQKAQWTWVHRALLATIGLSYPLVQLFILGLASV